MAEELEQLLRARMAPVVDPHVSAHVIVEILRGVVHGLVLDPPEGVNSWEVELELAAMTRTLCRV